MSDVATRIARSIELDILDRSGIGDEWERIGRSMRAQIIEEWARLIREELPSGDEVDT